MPATVDAIILLGWMERNFAVNYILNECVFDHPIDELAAEQLWFTYYDRVQAMPAREAAAPERLPLTDEEQVAADEFLSFHRRNFPGGGSVRDVIKVNPLGLVAHQFYVVLDRSESYMDNPTANARCTRNMLVTERPTRQIQIRHGMNVADVAIPHQEFALVYNTEASRFELEELAKHAGVSPLGNRMILWSGYHRAYARMQSAQPDRMESSSVLMALTTDADFLVSAQSPNQRLREVICGPRPPLFGDFFDDRFFMRTKLRKKRYELQIRAQVVAIDET
jgi:hypothetical protein